MLSGPKILDVSEQKCNVKSLCSYMTEHASQIMGKYKIKLTHAQPNLAK